MFQAKIVDKIKTHTLLCSITFFSAENLAIDEITWKNVVEPGNPQMTTWRIGIAC
jgi:hypothetical protein